MTKTRPEEIVSILREEISDYDTKVRRDETGTVLEVGDGIATVSGLDRAVYGELVEFDTGVRGMVMDLSRDTVGCVLLGAETGLREGSTVRRTGQPADVPVGEGMLGGRRVLFLKPQTFMNLSGEAVHDAAAFYKIPPERIIVLSDDISLDVGTLRVRAKGSAGGQNGLKNIIYHLGSEDFPRVKIGIGKKPHPDYDLAAWVLSKFTADEQKAIDKACEDAVSAAACIIAEGCPAAAQKFNGKRL